MQDISICPEELDISCENPCFLLQYDSSNEQGVPMRRLRLAVAQENFRVGDIQGNKAIIIEDIRQAVLDQADLIVFPELALTGYPPEDLVYKPRFLEENLRALEEIREATHELNILCVVGFIDRSDDIYNAAALLYRGEIAGIYRKIYLPNYGVFDEKRYFQSGQSVPVFHYHGVRIGVTICEDIWYPNGPGHYQASAGGAELILNISASPYHAGKQEYRERMYSARSGDDLAILVNCNLAGGQDELVFDGCSSAYDSQGRLISRLKAFVRDYQVFDVNISAVFRQRLKDIRRRETILHCDCPYPLENIEIPVSGPARRADSLLAPQIHPLPDPLESIYQALVTGTADYVNKNGFKDVIIAISGGIDSALVAVIAAEALGAERVRGIYLPTVYSADISGTDAQALCDNLGISLLQLPIQELFDHYLSQLEPVFQGLPFSTAEENLQSRIRGNIVMALSNKFGSLVLTTGNKSEMSTGYATLYGDMAGGFAVIKDVLKTQVYALAEYINREKEIIPRRIIERPPSAELRPDQKDTDSLPPYEVLDSIIRAYVEEDIPLQELRETMGDPDLVSRVVRLIDLNEYKRRQAPPGVKISSRAFGRDRRMPITNGYRT